MSIILVTGAAGFIGFHVSQLLLNRGDTVIGVDNLNDYYDVNLKKARLSELEKHPHFIFHPLNISEHEKILDLKNLHPDIDGVIHLAAQAGVRYSLTNPFAYSDSNLVGHLSILELCRHLPNLKHLVYASSSSVYGSNEKLPFSVEDRVDHPISLYAATKKSCELMSHCYSHLFQIPISGLRYFTVYGPWGRPDMSAFIFTKALFENKEIPVFNRGDMRRNFSYIDDVVSGTVACLAHPPVKQLNKPPVAIYNIGNNRSEALMDFIKTLEKAAGKKANLRMEPMQPGDVKETIADISTATETFGFIPKTNIDEGLEKFVAWYRNFYKI